MIDFKYWSRLHDRYIVEYIKPNNNNTYIIRTPRCWQIYVKLDTNFGKSANCVFQAEVR